MAQIQGIAVGDSIGQQKALRETEGFLRSDLNYGSVLPNESYFGGGGVKISRRAGSGFGFGFGAFLASFLPLSLLPMAKA